MARILQNELLKPGVYITETDSSQVSDVPNAPRNTALFYGLSESGPIGVPVLINSPKQFVELFGRPKLSWGLNASHGTWTAYTYLASGAGSIWFVRKQNAQTANQPLLHEFDFTGAIASPNVTVADITARTALIDIANADVVVADTANRDALVDGVTINDGETVFVTDIATLYNYASSGAVYTEVPSIADSQTVFVTSESKTYIFTSSGASFALTPPSVFSTSNVVSNWEEDYQNATTASSTKLYFKFPVYSVNGIYKDLQVSIRVVDVATEFSELLSTISNQETAESLKWLVVKVGTDIGGADEDILETFTINNTRNPMANGVSYWMGRLNRSSFISLAYSELFEDSCFDKLYNDVDASSTNTIIMSISDDTVTADVTPLDSDGTLQVVPSISRKEYPFVMVFVPSVVDATLASGGVNESIASIINDNQGLVYAIIGKGSGLDVGDYLDSSGQILETHANYGKFQSRVFPYIQKMRVFDPFSNKNVLLPVSTQAMFIMGFLKDTPWLPPAGNARGTVSALNVYPTLSDSEIGRLYNIGKLNCVDKTVNGLYLWGQRTAQKDASALDRINSVRTVVDLEIELEQGLKAFIFEIASASTLARIDKFLSDVRRYYINNEAVRFLEYEVDTSLLEYNQIDIKIRVLPTEAIEYINVSVNITREGVTVSES